ncbi:MAG: DUF2807 domain-containing protein [Bacteroidales bacterium]
MKTSNKILLGGLIVTLIFIATVLIVLKSRYQEEIQNRQASIEKQERELEPFKYVNISGNIRIRWVQNSEQKVFVEADNNSIEQVQTVVEDDKLTITYDGDNSESLPVLYLHRDTLRQIFLQGKCNFKTEHEISLDQIQLTMEDESRAILKGKSNNVVIQCGGESSLYANEFEITDCNIHTTDKSSAKIKVTDYLYIKAENESSVLYYGKPENVNINSSKEATTRGI